MSDLDANLWLVRIGALSLVVALVVGLGAIAAAVWYARLTSRLLKEQQQTTADQNNWMRAQTTTKISEAWAGLDEMMMEYGEAFKNRDPIRPLFLPESKALNSDRRLFIIYKFVGVVDL